MPRLARLVPPLLAILLAGAALAADPRLAVEKSPAHVELRSFDPANPPASMPALAPDERAQTVWNYTCFSNLRGMQVSEQERNGRVRVVMRVVSVSIKLDLLITLWLPDPCPPALRAHEQGHQRIVERLYATAERPARAAAETVLGRNFLAEADTHDAAVEASLKKAATELADAYIHAINGSTTRASATYDRLTDHGRRATPTTAQAAEQALR